MTPATHSPLLTSSTRGRESLEKGLDVLCDSREMIRINEWMLSEDKFSLDYKSHFALLISEQQWRGESWRSWSYYLRNIYLLLTSQWGHFERESNPEGVTSLDGLSGFFESVLSHDLVFASPRSFPSQVSASLSRVADKLRFPGLPRFSLEG